MASLGGVSKRFGTTQALRDVTFRVYPGEVHALLGENGAGKSTLIKVLTGIERPDTGTVEILGATLDAGDPGSVIRRGLSTVYQDLCLIGPLTVADNLFLGARDEPALASPRDRERRATAILANHGVTDFVGDDLVEDLSLGQRQRLEIVRALARAPEVLLLDEPTSALDRTGVDWLFSHIREQRERGVAIVFISHRIGEIRGLCDRVTVLRNGSVVGTFPASEVSDADIVHSMLGRSLATAFPPRGERRARDRGPAALAVRGLQAPGLGPTDIEVAPGDVVGVAGLDGHGQRSLFRALAGILPVTGGSIERDGRQVRVGSPADAIAVGIAYVPLDRAREGLLMPLPVGENMSLPILRRLSRRGLIDARAERRHTTEMATGLDLDPAKLPQPANALSGGNQQKALIGKWLLTGADVVILDDPTQGVDVGTKYEIGALIGRLASEGKAVLFHSTDLDELTHLADRVVVFYKGIIEADLDRDRSTPGGILAAMTGHTRVVADTDSVPA